MKHAIISIALFLTLALCALTALAAPVCVVGTTGNAPAAHLTFTAPTTNTDGTPIATPLTYDLFMGTATGAETLLKSGITGSPIDLVVGLAAGTTYYWYVETVDARGTHSAPSNEACKTFPASVPGSVIITIS